MQLSNIEEKYSSFFSGNYFYVRWQEGSVTLVRNIRFSSSPMLSINRKFIAEVSFFFLLWMWKRKRNRRIRNL